MSSILCLLQLLSGMAATFVILVRKLSDTDNHKAWHLGNSIPVYGSGESRGNLSQKETVVALGPGRVTSSQWSIESRTYIDNWHLLIIPNAAVQRTVSMSSSARATTKSRLVFSRFYFSCPASGGVANEQRVVPKAGSQRENEEKSVASRVRRQPQNNLKLTVCPPGREKQISSLVILDC